MVTMTSDVDKTKTTIDMANKSMPSPTCKSATIMKSSEERAPSSSPFIDLNVGDRDETSTAEATAVTINTNGISEDAEPSRTAMMTRSARDDDESDSAIVNNIATVEICYNPPSPSPSPPPPSPSPPPPSPPPPPPSSSSSQPQPPLPSSSSSSSLTRVIATEAATELGINKVLAMPNNAELDSRRAESVINVTSIESTTATTTISATTDLDMDMDAETNAASTNPPTKSITFIEGSACKAGSGNDAINSGGVSSSSGCQGKPPSHHQGSATIPITFQQHSKNENAPNILVYKKMEAIIERMQAEGTGVTVRTVKGFITKVPSVFTGADLIAWILKNLDVDDVTEALHFAHLLSSHGYIFPIDDHALTVKNDGTFYRFQTPYFWPSNCWEPENTDYAVYLCKRTMQNKTRLELADYEAENLAKLQKMFSRKWEFIFMQAESQSKVAKKRDKLERKVLDSQERAFWDVHRPMPGCINTTEIDIKKAYRRGDCSHGTGSAGASVTKNPIELLTRIIALRKQKLERRTIKISKAAEALVSYYEQYHEYDYFVSAPEYPNPWQTDSTEMWDAEKTSKEVPLRNVKRWAFNMRELLKDPIGREQFTKFLEKEYSAENILFWEAVQHMKTLPQSSITKSIKRIWQEFLAPDAPYAVNVDSKSIDLARDAVNSTNPNRWCFDVAAAHIYHLMERDSYPRYLRSDMYKDFLNCSRKKVKSIPNLFGVKR